MAPVDWDEVLVQRIGSAGIIRLNRPRVINSLNLEMVRAITRALEGFASDPEISCVVLTGEGARGFCAGGDIRALQAAGKAGHPSAARFLREEFTLNAMIARYEKPFIALMDGIVMGGGVGLSAHGSYRVVTERTRLAMPETAIGYIPDVGTTWLLPRAPGEAGTRMALTGEAVGAADAIFAGLADIRVPSTRLAALVEALSELRPGCSGEHVRLLLREFEVAGEQGALEPYRDLVDRCFRFDSVEDILCALDQEQSDFAVQTKNVMLRRSPTSLKLTLHLLRLGRESSGLAECLRREFTVAMNILGRHDFQEGVRAAIIDKDNNPAWHPAALADVVEAELNAYFAMV